MSTHSMIIINAERRLASACVQEEKLPVRLWASHKPSPIH